VSQQPNSAAPDAGRRSRVARCPPSLRSVGAGEHQQIIGAAVAPGLHEDLVGAIAHPSAVLLDAERCSQRSQSKALSPFNNLSIDRAHPVAISVLDFKSRASVSASRHIHAHRLGAPTPCRRASSALQRITNVCIELAGVPMEYVEQPDPRPEPISIARCRELLGEDAESMTDQDIEDIRRHADTMACIVVEMYQEQCRTSE